MRKILIGFIEDGKAGGIDRYLLNILKIVQSEELQIDFLTNEVDPELKKKLSSEGSRLFPVATLRDPFQQYRQVRKLIQVYQYDTVYLNVSTAIDCVAAWAAKKERVPRRILHSHSAGNDCENPIVRWLFNAIHFICRLSFYRTGTQFYGCSKKAGYWMFPRHIVDSDKFQVIFNAVESGKFKFDAQVREACRRELGLKNELTIGHVGNFCYVKNYPFLLKVFAEILKIIPDAKLLLVGTGGEFDETQNLARRMRIYENVHFLGWRADVERIFQAMDVFVFPSHFEGLGFVGVEAQLTGLPVIASGTVPEEMKITEDCHFVSLKKNPKEWADMVIKSKRKERKNLRFLENVPEFDLKKQEKELKGILDLFGGQSSGENFNSGDTVL